MRSRRRTATTLDLTQPEAREALGRAIERHPSPALMRLEDGTVLHNPLGRTTNYWTDWHYAEEPEQARREWWRSQIEEAQRPWL